MKKFTAILACAAALLLPSCITWDIGGHLKQKQTTYTGVDTAHPVDGKIYRPAYGKESYFYVTAPEVTYSYAYPAMGNGFGMQVIHPAASNVRPTGRVVTAKVEPANRAYIGSRQQATAISALPQGLCAEETFADSHDAPAPAVLSSHRNEPGFARRALIGSCDYVADPILNIITPPLELACYTVTLPFMGIHSLLSRDSQNTGESSPTIAP